MSAVSGSISSVRMSCCIAHRVTLFSTHRPISYGPWVHVYPSSPWPLLRTQYSVMVRSSNIVACILILNLAEPSALFSIFRPSYAGSLERFRSHPSRRHRSGRSPCSLVNPAELRAQADYTSHPTCPSMTCKFNKCLNINDSGNSVASARDPLNMDPMHEANEGNDSTSPPASQKRQRAKQACEPCRLRKRRCDGAMPCNMCNQFEYKCYFEKHPRKRSKLVEQNAHLEHSNDYVKPEPPKEDRTTLEDMSKMRSMEANSGIAFTRLLGQRLDPSSGP